MDLKISDEQMGKIIEAAVLSMLSGAERERIVTEAVKQLMTEPVESGYGKAKKTEPRFQTILRDSLELALRRKIDAYWESEEGAAKLNALVSEAIKASLDSAKIREAMARGLHSALDRGY